MTIVILFFISMILTGFGKAMRDTIAHHFSGSIFSNVKNKKLFKWFESDYRNFKLYYGVFRFDGWHTADFIMYCGVMLMIGLSAFIQDSWIAIFYYGGSMLFFQIFYKITLLKKN